MPAKNVRPQHMSFFLACWLQTTSLHTNQGIEKSKIFTMQEAAAS